MKPDPGEVEPLGASSLEACADGGNPEVGGATAAGGDPSAAWPELGDEVVLLRALRLDEAGSHHEQEDDEIRHWFHFPRASSLDDTLSWIRGNQQSFLELGPVRNLAIFERATGRLVGNCEARDLGDGTANISYAVFEPYRGRGLASRSVRLLLDYVRDEMRLASALIKVESANVASVGVARSLGFVADGVVTEDEVVYQRFVLDL